MTSRDAILNRIRTNLGSAGPAELPPVSEVWPASNPTAETMAERFSAELAAVGGEVVRCRTLEEARVRLAGLLDELECSTVGALDRPLCREVTGQLVDRVAWPGGDATARSMAEIKVGLLEAEWLLADTGSSVIACGTAQERLLCYLPPACIVVARPDRLVEHLPSAWPEIARRAGEPSLRGEFVVVTGPSRTADIEKILILGVHGPKRFVVLLIG